MAIPAASLSGAPSELVSKARERSCAVSSERAFSSASLRNAKGFDATPARYNRRALNLHRAARRIAAEGWPDDLTELPGVGRYTADAVARFAHESPALPVDTNVRRVIERTGGEFGPASAHALMDLGATICLARVPRCEVCPLADRCPSRGCRYEPLRKQSRFEGSFRQRRANTLRLVASGERRAEELEPEVLESLAADGLVEVWRGRARLPR
jgi:A/G-specific adenine glycosylase